MRTNTSNHVSGSLSYIKTKCYYILMAITPRYTILKVTTGVFLGNILTLCLLVALEPYVKVERRVITSFFK